MPASLARFTVRRLMLAVALTAVASVAGRPAIAVLRWREICAARARHHAEQESLHGAAAGRLLESLENPDGSGPLGDGRRGRNRGGEPLRERLRRELNLVAHHARLRRRYENTPH